MKKGFTLIEMIAVILILALIALTVLPNIINQLADKKDDVNEASLQIIYQATKLYMEENDDNYSFSPSSTYCITLETLTNDGKLVKPLKDLSTGEEISLDRGVSVVVDQYGDGTYTLKNKSDCSN